MRPTIAQGLFADDVVIAVGDPAEESPPLWPAEEALITRAVPKRRREFAMGRHCARQALAALGVLAFPLVHAESREPIWPPGIVGSLSHTAGLVAVAVAKQSAYASLGIDVEPEEGLSAEIEEKIATAEERAWLDQFPDGERGVMARVIFSAKECFYKCQHSVSQTFMGFQDASTTFDNDRFVVTFRKDVPPFRAGVTLAGRWTRRDGFILTGMPLHASAGYTRATP